MSHLTALSIYCYALSKLSLVILSLRTISVLVARHGTAR